MCPERVITPGWESLCETSFVLQVMKIRPKELRVQGLKARKWQNLNLRLGTFERDLTFLLPSATLFLTLRCVSKETRVTVAACRWFLRNCLLEEICLQDLVQVGFRGMHTGSAYVMLLPIVST